MVLAAGRGERLWPLTENKPKHLLPIAGRPVLERTLEALSKIGVREVLLVVNFKAEKIQARVGDGKR
ncbi:MAG TPA: sugar phosphate nucleotidyltransferase, partial [Candidatus Bathyarchaeia archaeon]|nr:sugar phosphate nucleotidyltransferase [Candidatus Bathyarchaeia archaeon]